MYGLIIAVQTYYNVTSWGITL